VDADLANLPVLNSSQRVTSAVKEIYHALQKGAAKKGTKNRS
jgi:hypothetical protein